MSLSTKLLTKFPALATLNWQLVLLKIGFYVVIAVSLYGLGRYHEKLDVAKKETRDMQQVVQKVEDFIPTLQSQATKAAEQNARTEKRQERYNEAVDQNARPDSCDLSPDELRAFQELAEG